MEKKSTILFIGQVLWPASAGCMDETCNEGFNSSDKEEKQARNDGVSRHGLIEPIGFHGVIQSNSR